MIQSLFTGLSGLIQEQKAMDVTAHNIANANTEGYTKQRINFSTNPTRDLGTIHIGTGVNTQSVERVHDEILFSKLKNYLADYSEANEEFKQLDRIKNNISTLESDGNDITTLLNNFFNSVQELSANPFSGSSKEVVKRSGFDVLKRGVMINDIFDEYKASISKEKELLNEEANSYLNQLDILTKKIREIEAGNELEMPTKDYANDLRDKRDLLEKKLSQIGNFHAFKDDGTKNGDINITDYGKEYNFTFDENGGRLGGLNKSINALDKFKSAFNESFVPISTKINEFITGDMNNPNDILQWNYDNKPSTQFGDFLVGFSSFVDGIKIHTDSTEAIFNNYKQQQDKLSKVNLDEEMTNMIRYQRAYEASAKVIQTSDEMLQTLLDIKR